MCTQSQGTVVVAVYGMVPSSQREHPKARVSDRHREEVHQVKKALNQAESL